MAMRPPPFVAASSGFTYVGLLLFIALLSAGALAAIEGAAHMQRRANEAELLHIGRQFQYAFQSFYEATPAGQLPYPRSLQDLLRDPRYPAPRRHLRKIYPDPLTGSEDWGIIEAPGGGIVGVFSQAEGRPIKTALFDDDFAVFEGKERYSDWVFSYSRLLSSSGLSRGASPDRPANQQVRLSPL
jgi:type II secretory pathway pseudopilin PulG